MSWGGAERERIPSRLHTTSVETDMGLKLMNHKMNPVLDVEPAEPPKIPIYINFKRQHFIKMSFIF